MRSPVVVVLALTAGAIAAPQPQAPVWADWVGDWDGKLKWQSCAIDGQHAATLPIEATDGVMSIDLTAAGDSLGAMTLVEDANGWIGQQGDVTVHLARVKDGLDVAVDLDSGCRVRTSTHRPSTGIAACDRLDGWARIENRCTRLGKPPLENAARVARQRESWSAARGDARAKLSAQCESRAQKVESELIDAGCAPNPDPAIGLRGAACQAVRRTSKGLGRCPAISADVSSLFEAKADQLAAAAQTANDANLPYVEAQCKQLSETIASVAQKYGCPP